MNDKVRRIKMVETQLIPRGIKDPRVLDAMQEIPRENFVPETSRSMAYEDRPIPIGEDQTISQPYMAALMTQALRLRGREKVLEIGAGSGYQTAILSKLAEHVYSIERIPTLAIKARETLKRLGYAHVTIMVGDGTKGDPEHAPFDAIIVTAGSPGIPPSLKEELADGGRLVIPVGGRGYQELHRITRHGDDFVTENLGGCIFVPLIGVEGWDKETPM
ncbi:MAG: protein-L-isoaspartate O-methyltransferase [Nitrospirae bacterium CG_4_9_14_3_um_filter_53_35]|nr:MAG: protein-L-isoaspartate O-methyltransferase [Nitrospirae bacterium CG2_30_53_67]PIS37357.1 MAG: protein-L-isoaspartate O-methyltransferase [Nitrospirae bacterium CG08_land_8_20_14_0_20_52_24]PIV82303.1 MAG: protein-L-isoaspartate O-methyltransferase [Nitrospirae bacterium CG17_big_fil_post_rev_8_21_14_2_50_50_9]PIW84662.1 MAG: protein-L-isoaspartate O-methyltransferase [Nitrospirae bacterium CG_4_8_14_3_um_filter_50_41]PJA77394.1 MAG: protein-L-isoaspartate O-methyltransferase [Nitrospir